MCHPVFQVTVASIQNDTAQQHLLTSWLSPYGSVASYVTQAFIMDAILQWVREKDRGLQGEREGPVRDRVRKRREEEGKIEDME